MPGERKGVMKIWEAWPLLTVKQKIEIIEETTKPKEKIIKTKTIPLYKQKLG